METKRYTYVAILFPSPSRIKILNFKIFFINMAFGNALKITGRHTRRVLKERGTLVYLGVELPRTVRVLFTIHQFL